MLKSYSGPNKPYKNIDEQIVLLKGRGLNITNELQAIEHLKTKGYYQLINAYKSVFLDKTKPIEQFKKGVEFDEIVAFYYFDETLRNLLFKYIILFENTFKNALSNCLSSNYGVSMNRYLDPSIFNNRKGKAKSILRKIWLNKKTNKNPTKHYRESKNHVPFWILSRNITFGQTQLLYSILKPSDKENVMRQIFNLPLRDKLTEKDIESYKKMLDLIIDITLDFRNNIAHNGNLVTYTSRKSLTKNGAKILWPKGVITTLTWNTLKIGRNDVYALLICIMSGLKCSAFDRSNFIYELRNNFIKRYSQSNYFIDYLKAIGFPQDIDTRLNEFQ